MAGGRETSDGDRVRVGVIGAGRAAQVVHLPILARIRGARIAGVADPDENKAETIANRFGAEASAPSLEELAEVVDLDAVVVCTPNDAHEGVALSALEAGLHVLCERPLATSSDAARRMLAAARDADRRLMVAMNHRFRLDLRHMRRFVRSGELGDPFFLRATSLNQRERRPRRGWRRDPDRAGGGVLMDLGVSAVDAALWLLDFPDVERVTAHFHHGDRVEESAALLLRSGSGVTVSVEVSWEHVAEGSRHGLFALGTAGSAETPPLELLRELETGPADVTPPMEAEGENVYRASYRQEWATFLRRVRRGEAPGDGRDQVELMEVVEACYRSAREGREVRV